MPLLEIKVEKGNAEMRYSIDRTQLGGVLIHSNYLNRESKSKGNEMDRYSLEEFPHGIGGYAKVRKGRDKILERDVAVKVLDPLATEFPGVLIAL